MAGFNAICVIQFRDFSAKLMQVINLLKNLYVLHFIVSLNNLNELFVYEQFFEFSLVANKIFN